LLTKAAAVDELSSLARLASVALNTSETDVAEALVANAVTIHAAGASGLRAVLTTVPFIALAGASEAVAGAVH